MSVKRASDEARIYRCGGSLLYQFVFATLPNSGSRYKLAFFDLYMVFSCAFSSLYLLSQFLRTSY